MITTLIATLLSAMPQAPTAPAAPDLAPLLRAYFDAASPRGAELQALVTAAANRQPQLVAMLAEKTFLAERAAVERFAAIRDGRLVDPPDDNPALFTGPAVPTGLAPLLVYVPDAVYAKPFTAELRAAAARGWFVYLVPDSLRDNRYLSTPKELDRHTGPLRDLLLHFPIDPDRICFTGSGRGGHACWDTGLMRSGRFAAICPCNGGTVHEGGLARTGGVFVENGRDLTIFLTFNNTFDHGIESCRHAVKLLTQWGARIEVQEETAMRVLSLEEATAKLADAKRTAHRRSITKRFNRLPDGAHYWLEALDRRPGEWDPEARVEVKAGDWPKQPELQRQAFWKLVQDRCARLAGIVAGNRMRIEAQGVGRLRVWFDPELVDFGAKVDIEIGGKVVRSVQPKRRLDVMLARVWATGDTSALYWDHVDLVVPK